MLIATPEAYQLLHNGSQVLAQMEHHGIRIDVPYLQKTIAETGTRIKELQEKLKSDPVFADWHKKYGTKTNLGSRSQLASLLFDDMEIPYLHDFTATGRYRADEEVLKSVNLPFVHDYLRLEEFKKFKSTFLEGLHEEVVDGYVHPVFNLHLVKSYRSSSDSPNLQNQPVRDAELGPLIRRCFIPRKGRVLVEVDFVAIEVRISACVVGTTSIETIDGPQTIIQIIDKLRREEEVLVYGYDRDLRRVAISEVREGGLTKKRAEVWKVTLDNGQEVRVTKEHQFLVRTGDYKKACDLSIGESLMPFYKVNKKSNWGTVYEKIYLNNGSSMLAHNLIALDVHGITIAGSSRVVHHKDGNGCNNSLSNLHVMDRKKHMEIHAKQGWERKKKGKRFVWCKSPEGRASHKERMRKRSEEWSEEKWEEFGQRVSEGIKRKGGRKGKKNSMFGKNQSEETKKKISEAKKGKKTGRPAWSKGHTKETHPGVLKISLSNKGRASYRKGKKFGPLPEETKEKISLAMQGRDFSSETRKKIGEKTKEYWRTKEKEKCPVCKRQYLTLGSHMLRKHGLSPKEYEETYNHKVISIEFDGYEDVYNITVQGIHNYALSAGVIVKNCYNKDPVLLEYINDPTKDMHRDTAAQCFLCELEQVTKQMRYVAKNCFVFPQFYGSYHVDCARNLWNGLQDVKLASGKGVRRYLRFKGIRELGACDPKQPPKKGTYEFHIKSVQDDFWGNRFKVYSQWKKDWYDAYLKTGEFRMLTGFVVQGVYKRNEVLNLGTQGSAFHCLLWSSIEIQKELKQRRMRTKLVGEVHDSLLADVPTEEVQDYLDLATEVMTRRLPEYWDWIICPLAVEVEIGENNWAEKKSWVHQDGTWQPKETV